MTIKSQSTRKNAKKKKTSTVTLGWVSEWRLFLHTVTILTISSFSRIFKFCFCLCIYGLRWNELFCVVEVSRNLSSVTGIKRELFRVTVSLSSWACTQMQELLRLDVWDQPELKIRRTVVSSLNTGPVPYRTCLCVSPQNQKRFKCFFFFFHCASFMAVKNPSQFVFFLLILSLIFANVILKIILCRQLLFYIKISII